MAIGLIKGNSVVALNEEATAASGTIQVINNTFDASDAVIINGVSFEESVDWSAGGDVNASAAALQAAIAASNNKLISGVVVATVLTDTVTITAALPGTGGNSITLAETDGATDNFTLSGAVLAGGATSEGTAATPSAAEDFIQVLSDGLEIAPAKELVERTILTSSIGKVSPRVSVKSATGGLPIEWRASGVEGQAPEYDIAMRALLGTRRQRVSQLTTGAGHGVNSLNIASATDFFTVGDFIVILEAGAHHSAFVTAVNAGDISFKPDMSGAPSDNVVIAKSTTYAPTNVDQPTFTKNVYWGDEILEQMIGARAASLSVENFTTGQIPNLTFATESLSFNESDASAAFTPSFDSGLPPLALNVGVWQDDVCLDINEFALSVENTVSSLTSVKSADGRISSRFTERVLSGSFNPYKDDTSIAQFTRFDQNTLFSMVITAQNGSGVTGEFDLGSCVGIYLPSCLMTSKTVGDTDGVLVENIEFSANRGTDGLTEEIFVGFC